MRFLSSPRITEFAGNVFTVLLTTGSNESNEIPAEALLSVNGVDLQSREVSLGSDGIFWGNSVSEDAHLDCSKSLVRIESSSDPILEIQKYSKKVKNKGANFRKLRV